MLRYVYRGLAGAALAASLVGCGSGGDVTTMPDSMPTLSPEMQDFKSQVIKQQQERMAHHGGSAMSRYARGGHR